MARRSQGMPQEPGYTPGRTGEESLLHRRAENGDMVAYTPDEYGVRKDDGVGVIKPVNSSNGLLFLAILLTVAMGGLVYFVVQVILQDAWAIAGEVWWVFPACIFPFAAAWYSYAKERKAEKLRQARNLPRPVE
ncbi:hypothetical protein [Pseudarthrobacter sp. 1C304]|uniref:hypothetical protein n=1 Tax=Pseudarthrobacter sp. 1C304 TaxID=3457438 RepID=UPI003FD28A2D